MLAKLRAIDPSPYLDRVGTLSPEGCGPRPRLAWIAIECLRVDPVYQRHILKRGAANVAKIASEFDWAKFGTVIAAEVEDGIFAIIDGQHRATAAALRGHTQVPCQIVDADRAKQAAAFASINGQVTAITPMQLYHAKVAAEDVTARELAGALEQADVRICRYPIPAKLMAAGDTLAVGSLAKLLRQYGAEVLVPALRCITRTRKGNPGYLRAQIITALCTVLEGEPDWFADEEKLLRVMQRFDFQANWIAAQKASVETGDTITACMISIVTDHLEKGMA